MTEIVGMVEVADESDLHVACLSGQVPDCVWGVCHGSQLFPAEVPWCVVRVSGVRSISVSQVRLEAGISACLLTWA